MKKSLIILALAGMSTFFTSCDLLQADEIVNPNVDEDTFLTSYNPMTPWRNGMERDFATTIGTFVELTELVSDNYFNNYTQSSKVFDYPQIEYHDTDVTNLQRLIAKLRESANYGINKVAPADNKTTAQDLFTLKFIRAYSYLLAGEFFTGLPMQENGQVRDWKSHLREAISELSLLDEMTTDDDTRAAVNVLIARSYYLLGESSNATFYAVAALNLSSEFVYRVNFDGDNSVTNSMQTWIYGTAFQPLPRLDFLDPKYFQSVTREQRPIAIAKAEEAHLIIAEAYIAQDQLTDAAQRMKQLLNLVQARPTITINDENETRGRGTVKIYPNSDEYLVAASPEDPLRSGLVLNRGKDHREVTVPYISGTSVTAAMIDQGAASGTDALLETLYLMRQEIFIAEGRRMSDLGIRFPVCFKEEAVNPTTAGFTQAQIPAFIPLRQGMDNFTIDTVSKTVVIDYNMNKIIVTNKNSAYVAPFFQ